MPALADLAPGAGDLPTVEVDWEIVPVGAFVPAMLAGGVARQRPAEGDLVFSDGSFQVDQRGVAAVDQGVLDELVHGEGTQERADRAVLRLRVAECRLAFGEIDAAIGAIEEAGRVAAGLPERLAVGVEEVRREVDLDVTERLADPRAAQG